jgi:hypothetical protein
VNRVHPRFGRIDGWPADRPPGEHASPADTAATAWAQLTENLDDFDAIGAREEGYYAELAASVAPAPVVRVPFLSGDVHDLEGLAEVVRYLMV